MSPPNGSGGAGALTTDPAQERTPATAKRQNHPKGSSAPGDQGAGDYADLTPEQAETMLRS